MNIFIKRNESIQMKKHEREMNKIKEQEIRHNKNIILEQEKFEKKENDNKDKIMKKYITFYWNRKGREEKKKNNFVHFNEKYDERYVRLEEIEKAHEKKQKSFSTIPDKREKNVRWRVRGQSLPMGLWDSVFSKPLWFVFFEN